LAFGVKGLGGRDGFALFRFQLTNLGLTGNKSVLEGSYLCARPFNAVVLGLNLHIADPS
jgi:hypothetical protein